MSDHVTWLSRSAHCDGLGSWSRCSLPQREARLRPQRGGQWVEPSCGHCAGRAIDHFNDSRCDESGGAQGVDNHGASSHHHDHSAAIAYYDHEGADVNHYRHNTSAAADCTNFRAAF